MFFFLKQTATLTSKGLYQNMQANIESALEKTKINLNPIRVRTQVPQWLNDNHPIFVNFVQYYYDWLVNSYGNAGTNLLDMAKLFDIDETPEYILPNFVKSYAPDLMKIYDMGVTHQPTPEQIRRTITNIKTEVYQRKSNEDAFRTLMPSLFEIDPTTIKISYPKRKLMRLNAGRLDWMTNNDYYGVTGDYFPERYTMVGSHLNQGVLQDGGMWQEFSYVISSEVDDSNEYYETIVNETLHPAGLIGLHEKIKKYSEGESITSFPVVPLQINGSFENPKIANYYPYTLGSSETLAKCNGCTGPLFVPGWTFPTFVYPTWDPDISSGPNDTFGSIKIFDFFELYAPDGQNSPNDIIGTECSPACDIGGTADFSWYILSGEEMEYNDLPAEDFPLYPNLIVDLSSGNELFLSPDILGPRPETT